MFANPKIFGLKSNWSQNSVVKLMLTLVDNSVPLLDDMRARGFSDFGSCQLFGLDERRSLIRKQLRSD